VADRDQNPELAKLRALWVAAAIPPGEDRSALAPAFGRNWRVNLKSALKAAYHTALLYLKAKVAAATYLAGLAADPIEVLEIPAEAFEASTAIVRAVSESMQPLEYAIYVVLSAHDGEVAEAGLASEIRDFLGSGQPNVPWWLRLSSKAVERARRAAATDEGVREAVALLVEKGCAQRTGSGVKYKAKNFETGFRTE